MDTKWKLLMHDKELQLLGRRIDAVAAVLEHPRLSDWAKNYWTNVLGALVRKNRAELH
jgi:hypothetical protein